jgi:hypothetical protein
MQQTIWTCRLQMQMPSSSYSCQGLALKLWAMLWFVSLTGRRLSQRQVSFHIQTEERTQAHCCTLACPPYHLMRPGCRLSTCTARERPAAAVQPPKGAKAASTRQRLAGLITLVLHRKPG